VSIRNPFSGKDVFPSNKRVWAFSFEEHKKNETGKMIWWGRKGEAKVPAKKNFLADVQQGIMPTTLLTLLCMIQ
jgi:hypothetical protein